MFNYFSLSNFIQFSFFCVCVFFLDWPAKTSTSYPAGQSILIVYRLKLRIKIVVVVVVVRRVHRVRR